MPMLRNEKNTKAEIDRKIDNLAKEIYTNAVGDLVKNTADTDKSIDKGKCQSIKERSREAAEVYYSED